MCWLLKKRNWIFKVKTAVNIWFNCDHWWHAERPCHSNPFKAECHACLQNYIVPRQLQDKQADRKIRVELVYSIDKVVTMKKIPYLSVQLTQRSTISLCLLSQKAHVCQQFWTSWQSLRDIEKFNKVPVTHGLSPFPVCNLLHQHGTLFATLCENK